ncbi:hypothetical protein [Luteimicrobium subarcticum]|uniref:Tetratricopeptide repeat protein n=1 Tax=Luteimicrobium subarcticum TaxID=620910 RepID=A0A2M8WR62_9MICO|nr:hypothetical protein CLV34_1988 [Luteimicrobium subarcticum]
MHEDALRAVLSDNPNDVRAFGALAEIVRRRAAEANADTDPLAGHADADRPVDDEQRRRAADNAEWALAEELAGNPRAWYPLVSLARLSMDADREGALRRLATAAERDSDGEGLAAGLALLREHELPQEALGLGVGHWRPREHTAEAGRQIVLAALDADRPLEARMHLESLVSAGGDIGGVRDDLEHRVAHAEQHIAGT